MDSKDVLAVVVGGFAFVAILLAGAAFLGTLLSARRRDQRVWAARLLRAEDMKAGALARELHDTFVPTLMASVYRWDGLAPPELLAAIQKVASDLRALSHDLHPNSIDAVGLVGALGDLVQEWAEASPQNRCVLETKGPCEASQGGALALYRVAQAALANVREHAGAGVDVRVLLYRRGDQVVLEISDTGVGFNRMEMNFGLGLRSMQERAIGVGGTFRVRSFPGHGTTVVATVPALMELES